MEKVFVFYYWNFWIKHISKNTVMGLHPVKGSVALLLGSDDRPASIPQKHRIALKCHHILSNKWIVLILQR